MTDPAPWRQVQLSEIFALRRAGDTAIAGSRIVDTLLRVSTETPPHARIAGGISLGGRGAGGKLLEVAANGEGCKFVRQTAACEDGRGDRSLAGRLETVALLDGVEVAILPSLGMLVPGAVDVKLDGNQRANHQHTGGNPPVRGSLSTRSHSLIRPDSSLSLYSGTRVAQVSPPARRIFQPPSAMSAPKRPLQQGYDDGRGA